MGYLSTRNRQRNEISTLTNRLLDDFWNETSNLFDFSNGLFNPSVSKFSYPRVNIIDAEKEVNIEASVPGLTKEQVSVEYSEGYLIISGGSDESKETKEKDYRRREITKRKFSRSFLVDEKLFDVYNIDAKVENGLLTIKIPKIPELSSKTEVKRIEVK